MSKTKKRASVAAAFAFLIDAFPRAFTPNPKLRQPLKVGIADDLIVRLDGAIQPRQLRLALTLCCSSAAYLRACAAGAERVDLDGNVTGVVTAAEAAHAVDKLAELKAKKGATNEATKQQPSPPAEAPKKRLSITDLKTAARTRREAAS